MTLAITFACVVPLAAQATNDASLTFTVNGVDDAAPNTVQIQRPGTATLDITTQNPNLPVIIAFGSGITIADQIIGPVQVDVGPAAGTLVNGVSPTTFIDFLGNTGAGGSLQFSFPLGTQLATGPLVALQAFAVDFTAPGGVVDSSATLIELIAPIDYGTVSYLRGTSTGDTNSFAANPGVGATAFNLPSANFDIESFNLNNFSEFVAASNEDIRAEVGPAALGRAITRAKNSSFDHIATIHGDVYLFDDLNSSPREFGFAIQGVSGTPLTEIPGTRFNNPTSTGFSTTNPFEFEGAVSPDQSTLAVVYDPSSGPDQVFLIKLDGTTFASTGTAVVDVTPGFANTAILEESLRFSGNNIYFVDGTTTGNMFRAPLDGSAAGTVVTFPNIGGGLPVTIVDGEVFYVSSTDSLIVQAGNSATAEDLFVISNTGGVETITNITNFGSATQIEEFGDAYDGIDGQIAVSPDGSRCAFIVVDNADDELYWVTTDGLGTPEHLTPDTNFAVEIDDIIELNFYNNQNIMFFAGTSTSAMDLYNADVSVPAAPSFTNVTLTNGQSGATLPIANAAASVDPDGLIFLADRMIFGRDGTPSAGTGSSTSFGLVGVEYATLTPYNILGDEFAGAAGEVGFETSQTGFELTFSATGNQVWFKSSVGGSSSSDEELFGFDATVSAPATNFTLAGGVGSAQVDNISPDPTGISCAFSYRPSSTGDEEVFLAVIGVPGVTQVTDNPGSSDDVTDGSIVWFPLTNPSLGFVYAQGTTSTANPSDAVLRAVDISTGLTTDIDDTQEAYHVTAISFP
jgi:hypothetical protein